MTSDKPSAFDPPRGRQPSIEWVPIDEINVDPSYQRSIETKTSRGLIASIAREWDWDVFDVLKVSRRPDDRLFVVDGQHRLAAARERGDIPQLPCVLKRCAGPEEEARLFTAANHNRKAMSTLDAFRAAVAGGEEQAVAVAAAIDAAGLTVAPHSNFTAWKPGMVSNVAGIRAALRARSAAHVIRALRILLAAYPSQVLRYAGTLFPGIEGLIGEREVDDARLAAVIGSAAQLRWIGRFAELRAKGHTGRRAAIDAIAAAYDAECRPAAAPVTGGGVKPALTFQQQLDRVANGAKLVTVQPLRRPDPEGTLGGVGSAML